MRRMLRNAAKIAGIVMLLCLCAALMTESTRAEDGLELESVPDAYTVYLEGQTRVALGSISMTEASCRTLNLRKSPEWTLERVSGTSLTVHAEGTSRTLDDGTVIYGCNLILYSVSQTGDTVYDLTCKAGKRTVTQRFTVHSVHCGTGIPTNIAFARTSYQADVNERITVEPAILCTPSTAELPEEAAVHCVLDSQGTAALNQSVFAVTRSRTVLAFAVPGTYQAVFTYTLSNLLYSVPVTFEILDDTHSVVVQARSISLNHPALWLTVNEQQTLSPVFAPVNADNQEVSWISSNPSVATVSETGQVTAKSLGTAIITCRPADSRCPSATCFVTVEEWLTVEGLEEDHIFYLQGEQHNTLFRLKLSEGTVKRIQTAGLHVEWLLIPQNDTAVATQMYIAPDRRSATVETDAFRQAGVYSFEVRCETEMVEWSGTFTVEVKDLGEDAPESVTIATQEVFLTVGESATVDFTPVCIPETSVFPEAMSDGFAAYTGYGGFYGAVDRSVYRVNGDSVTAAFTEEGSYLLLRTWKIYNLSYSVSCLFVVDDADQPELINASETEAVVYMNGKTASVSTYRIDSSLYEMLSGQIRWGLERLSGNSTTAVLDVNGDHADLLILDTESQGQDVWQISCFLQGITVKKLLTVDVLQPKQALPESIGLENTHFSAKIGRQITIPIRVICAPEGSALPDTGDSFWSFRMAAGQEDVLLESRIENDCLQVVFCESGYYAGSLVYQSGNVTFETLLDFAVSDEGNGIAVPQEIFVKKIEGADTVYPEGETNLRIATFGLSESAERYVPGGMSAYARAKGTQWTVTRTDGSGVDLAVRDCGNGTAEVIVESISGVGTSSWLIKCTIDGRSVSAVYNVRVAQPEEERPDPRLQENLHVVNVCQGVLMSNNVLSSSGSKLQAFTGWNASDAQEAINHQYESYEYGWYAKFYIAGDYQTTVDVYIGNLHFELPLTIRVVSDDERKPVIVIPSGVKTIEEEAFAGSAVVIVDASGTRLESIGKNAFLGCTQLTDIYLPDSVGWIDTAAFSGCRTVVIHCREHSYAEQWAAGREQIRISHDLSR